MGKTTKKETLANSQNAQQQNAGQDVNNINGMGIELEICWDKDCERFKVDEEALANLDNSLEDWVLLGTYLQVRDLIRGLDSHLARKVVRYIGDFCWGFGRTQTGIEWLDCHLLRIYKSIYQQAQATGHVLGMPGDLPF